MIPMRDGTKLFTQIYTPAGVTTPLPIVFQRTPYGVGRNTPPWWRRRWSIFPRPVTSS